MVCFHYFVFANHVQVGILQTGKGLLARVFARSGRTHGHGGHVVFIFAADVAVCAAHGFRNIVRHFNRQNGRLHHNRALAQLVDALWRGGKSFYYMVNKGAQLGVRLLTFRQRGVTWRGTALDPFGRTVERKAERAWIVEYQSCLERLLGGLTQERLALAVEIASVPENIRGYGHVKERHLAAARSQWAQLLQRWNDAEPSTLQITRPQHS